MTGLLARVVELIPSPPPDVDPSTGKGPEWGKAAPVGLLVILLLCIATFFLLRSMNRKIKAVPKSFEPPAPGASANVEDQATGAPAAGPALAVEPADPPAGSTPPDLVNERSS
ncbi:MAG: hypothetical protein ABWZ98_06000 [Nakamurella sp.]